MAARWMMQLLPTEEQAGILIEALKLYELEHEGDEDKEYLASELRLEILKKRREAKERDR